MSDQEFGPDSDYSGEVDGMRRYTVADIAAMTSPPVTVRTVRKWAKSAGFSFSRGYMRGSYFSEKEVERILSQRNPMWYVSRGKKTPTINPEIANSLGRSV